MPSPERLARRAHVHSSSKFAYSGRTRTLTVEASTLGLQPGQVPSQIRIRSERTGSVELFIYERVVRDGDGDVRQWEYRSTTPGLGLSLLVWND